MLGLFMEALHMKPKRSVPLRDLNYMVSMLHTSAPKAHHNESVRLNVLEIAKKVKDAVKHNEYPEDHKKDALTALNKVKIHALVSGSSEDYRLFVQLDRVTRDLDTA